MKTKLTPSQKCFAVVFAILGCLSYQGDAAGTYAAVFCANGSADCDAPTRMAAGGGDLPLVAMGFTPCGKVRINGKTLNCMTSSRSANE